MKDITSFKAVYLGGMVIPDDKAVTALSLLFNKIYLPINIEFIKEFSKNYKFISKNVELFSKNSITFKDESDHDADPFYDLKNEQKKTAIYYLHWATNFSIINSQLYGEVFETNAFENNTPYKIELVKKGKPGKKNLYRMGPNKILLTEGGDTDIFSDLMMRGYLPILGHLKVPNTSDQRVKDIRAKTLAAMLAMKSIEIIIPDVKGVEPEIILEARHKLSNHLPVFWSAMLKLSTELKKYIKECRSVDELIKEGDDIVDTIVRPALIDLNRKIELERKNWFYKILEPIGKSIRILIGHPGLTIQELMTSSLLLSTDIASSTMNKMQIVDKLKSDSGLTYLMELNKIISKKD